MTDLDDLRAALAEPPAEAFAEVDLARVMRVGGRRRRGRRLAAGAAALVAVAAVGGTVAGVQAWRTIPSTPAVTTPAARPGAVPLGEVIGTGVADQEGEVVLYLRTPEPARYQSVSDPARYELVLGHRTAYGVVPDTVAAAYPASPGFHGLTAGRPGRDVALYGYYVGPAASVTAEAGGLTYAAKTSVAGPVTFFWFPREDAKALGYLPALPLKAYDGNGYLLRP